MADSTSGATVRVPAWLADQLDDIVKHLPRGNRPTRGDLVADAWRRANAAGGENSATEQPLSQEGSTTTLTKEVHAGSGQRAYDKKRMPAQSPIPKAHEKAHALLEQILASGDQKAIEWINGNLKMFAEALEGRGALPPDREPNG